jgi:hypothetical protein
MAWWPPFLRNLSITLGAGIGAWFAAWGIRYRWKLDIVPDKRARTLRWLLAGMFLFVAAIPDRQIAALRLAAMVAFWAFLVWPNLAVYLVRALDRVKGRKALADVE